MSRWLAAALAAMPAVLAAQKISYVDSSSPEKLESRVDIGIGDDGLGLNADMTLVGLDGTTKVLPRITSSWTTLEFLDVKTVFVYPDLNVREHDGGPTLRTSVLVRSELPFLDRLEATLKSAETSEARSLHMRFAELGTGIELFGGRPLGVRSDLTLRGDGERAAAASSVTSSWGVGPALDVETVLELNETPNGGIERSKLDTTLTYASPLPFIERFEGRVRSEGETRAQSLAVLFPELSAGAPHGTSFSVTGRALIEELLAADGAEQRRIGLETKISHVAPPLVGGRSALSFKIERSLAEAGASRSSLAYDHAWSPSDEASIGLNLGMRREAEEIEPSIDLTWSTRF